MLGLTIILMISSLLLGVCFFGLFVWALSDGQFENSEAAKYFIFHEESE
jgi:cbb3-type cytochrome oxidase maturation protein